MLSRIPEHQRVADHRPGGADPHLGGTELLAHATHVPDLGPEHADLRRGHRALDPHRVSHGDRAALEQEQQDRDAHRRRAPRRRIRRAKARRSTTP